jgi:hypothetical protein
MVRRIPQISVPNWLSRGQKGVVGEGLDDDAARAGDNKIITGREEMIHGVAWLGDPDLAGETAQPRAAAVSIHGNGLTAIEFAAGREGRGCQCFHGANLPGLRARHRGSIRYLL